MLEILIAANYGFDHVGFPGVSGTDELERLNDNDNKGVYLC